VQLSERGVVVVAAGALVTPKILMESGIGPLKELHKINTHPGVQEDNLVQNENVGEHLFDTTLVIANFRHEQMDSF